MKAPIKKFINHILILLGVILLSLFIWFRFIRVRLPKEIPFKLSEIGLLILIYICLIYIVLIIALVYKFKASENNISAAITKYIALIYKPLIVLDESMKTHVFIKPYYEKYLIKLVSILTPEKYFQYYFLVQIFPRIILVSALIADTFYFSKIHILYKVILISLLIFIGKYILYSIKYAKEQYTLQLEPMVDRIFSNYKDETADPYGIFLSTLSVRRFVDEQVFSIVYNDSKYTYNIISSSSYDNAFCLKHNLSLTHQFAASEFLLIKVELNKLLELIVALGILLDEYELKHDSARVKHWKICIFSGYLICWSYILVVSLHTLPKDSFSNFPIFLNNIEPFSGLML